MGADVAVVLVHYFTPDLVAQCVAALRRDLGQAGLTAEWVLVDNGSEAGNAGLFEALGLRVLTPGENLGYAGGVNLGAAQTTAPVLLILNPDVLVLPGCVAALAAELAAGAAAVGPRLFWDRELRLMLPVNEVRTRRQELRASLAERSDGAAARARRAWRRHARRHWQATVPVESFELSGAMLALRRDAWNRLGPFDAGYRLYFEETDWLERLRRSGGIARHVPGARAIHLYNQSGSRESRTGAWFAASRERFQSRYYGRWFHRLIRRVEAYLAASQEQAAGPEPLAAPPPLELPSQRPLWVEVSSCRAGFPAAAERILSPDTTVWRLPAEVWQDMAPGDYRLRTVTEGGEELSVTRWRKG